MQQYYLLDRASGALDAQLLSSQTVGTFTFSSENHLGTQSWNSPVGFKAILTIDSEQLIVSALSIATGTVTATIDTRGFNGTTAATHGAGSTVQITANSGWLQNMQSTLATDDAAILNGLIPQASITTIAAVNSHTIANDQTLIFTAGRVYVFKVAGVWYRSVIRSSVFAIGTTTISLTGDALPGAGVVQSAGFEFVGSVNKAVDYLLIKEATNAPADTPPVGYSWLFAKAKGWFIKDSDGKTRFVCAVRAIAASVAGVLTLDWSLANVYDVTLTENITGVTHQNGAEGEPYSLRLKQHASSPKTVVLGTGGGTRFSNDKTTYTMTPDVNAYDILGFLYNATDVKFDLQLVIKGFQASPTSTASVDYQVYGDGSDGALALDGANTYGSILSKSGSVYTALRDLFVSDLTMSGGAILDMAGFKLYGNGTLSGTGTVRNNGSTGGNGGDSNTGIYNGDAAGLGGGGGAPAPGITVPSGVTSGTGGRSAYQGGPISGLPGSNATLGYTSTSGASGGAGGNGGPGGGAGGTVAPATRWRPKSIPNFCQWFEFSGTSLTVVQVGPGAGGGGGGAYPGGSGTPNSGGGGGGGGIGGWLFVAFRVITGSIAFQARGGVGGAGGAGTYGTNHAGGGGGAGGNGGVIFLAFNSAFGYTTDVTGGAGGAGGAATGGVANFPGSAGSVGNAGSVVTLQLT